jgi:prolyl-tRNA synthetase
VVDQNGEPLHPWQNSWGFSTRSIGALILSHGDDNGLLLPPAIAPVQIIVVPIVSGTGNDTVMAYAQKICGTLKPAFRVCLDTREGETPGFKFNKWELKGVPLRLEIGKREAEQKTATVVRRDTGEKQSVALAGLAAELKKLLAAMQQEAFARHKAFTETHTHDAKTYDELKDIMKGERGFIRAFWCENAACEKKIKDETKATTRCLPLDAKEESGTCVYCGAKATHRWLFGLSY